MEEGDVETEQKPNYDLVGAYALDCPDCDYVAPPLADGSHYCKYCKIVF
jgi:hypothetical protein